MVLSNLPDEELSVWIRDIEYHLENSSMWSLLDGTWHADRRTYSGSAHCLCGKVFDVIGLPEVSGDPPIPERCMDCVAALIEYKLSR